MNLRKSLFIAFTIYSRLWFNIHRLTAGKWKRQKLQESELNEQQSEIRRKTNKCGMNREVRRLKDERKLQFA
jgi:hypothetical protein